MGSGQKSLFSSRVVTDRLLIKFSIPMLLSKSITSPMKTIREAINDKSAFPYSK